MLTSPALQRLSADSHRRSKFVGAAALSQPGMFVLCIPVSSGTRILSGPYSVMFPEPWRQWDRIPCTAELSNITYFRHLAQLWVSSTNLRQQSVGAEVWERPQTSNSKLNNCSLTLLSVLQFFLIFTWLPHIFIYLIIFDALGFYTLPELCQSLDTIFHHKS